MTENLTRYVNVVFSKTQQITRLAINGAPLVVCDLAEELLCESLLLLILSALALQLLELQVLETLGLHLQHFTVLNTNTVETQHTAKRAVHLPEIKKNKTTLSSFK